MDWNQIQPLVSVIVPIYGIERYIGLCIESLLHQTYRNLEIILVNDGSPDRCGEICRIYERKDDRIRVVHKENGGLVSARQAGLEVSAGSLICNVDGDDWVDPDFVRIMVEAQLRTGADAVLSGHTRHFLRHEVQLRNRLPEGVYEGEMLQHLKSNMLSTGDYYSLGIYTYLWNKLFKREIIYPHQMAVNPRISQGEDAACVYPALDCCSRVCVIGDTSYHYRQREDSMLKSQKPFDQQLPGIRLLYQHLCTHLPETYRQQIEDYVLHIITVRSGGLLPAAGAGYPFGVDLRGKRIALCSAGTFGQQLYARLSELGCAVGIWVDEDYWACRRCCLDVDAPEELRDKVFDYAVIATLDHDSCQSWTRRLTELGVDREKICTINADPEKRRQALHEYLTE